MRTRSTQEFTAQDFLVLVVDDTVDNLVIISLHLQQAGYRVVTATNGEEAIKVAALTQPDLILMDLGMPGLDGLGATRKIHEHPGLRPVPIVAVTAFTTEAFSAPPMMRAWRATSPSPSTLTASTISSAACCP
jgi:CheY-like chemotaxis protein